MFRNPQRPDHSAPFKTKGSMKINFLKFVTKKVMPDFWRKKRQVFFPSPTTVR